MYIISRCNFKNQISCMYLWVNLKIPGVGLVQRFELSVRVLATCVRVHAVEFWLLRIHSNFLPSWLVIIASDGSSAWAPATLLGYLNEFLALTWPNLMSL